MAQKTHRTNRVSVRTLVLMVELLGFFVAYQCLAFMPARTPARTCAAPVQSQPHKSPVVNVPGDSTVSTGDRSAAIVNCTPALRRAVEDCETAPRWRSEGPADPNDRVEPDDSEPVSEDVE